MVHLAEIVINRTTNQLNKPFVYMIPESMPKPAVGTRVYVPLGGSKEEGIIVNYVAPEAAPVLKEGERFFLCQYEGKDRIPLRSILRVLDKEPWFTEEMIQTARQVSAYFLCPLGEALQLFTITKKLDKGYERPKERWLHYNGIACDLKRKKKQAEIVALLKEKGDQSLSYLRKKGFSTAVINAVQTLPCISVREEFRATDSSYEATDIHTEIPLTETQQAVCDKIKQAMTGHTYHPMLLHGVTGSGKTQVYIKSVQECLRQGKSAIVLVPEISLTYQIVKRFVEHFGNEVVVFHSQLTVNERYNNWERLRRGESHIIIGARSAIFAPMTDIGLIILDEEHDASYKDWDNSHYHARTVAAFRCQYFQCPLLLGSATPSIVSYYKAQTGAYELLEMPERIENRPLPSVSVIDMKEELFFGNRSVFSGSLRKLISETLAKKEQLILLMNRRGYSTFILCRECGKPLTCPHCDTSLIYHKANEHLRCHYCEYTEPLPKICPHCGSQKIKFFGSGTQKVEELLRKEFPTARIARLDQDVKRKKGEVDTVLENFGKGQYDILLGTQMVSKGHDFPKVTAVGVITADSTLNIPNYTAAERTFSLLTQTAGRAGRGATEGKVVIQTYNPSHYAIMYSKTHDYLNFYEEEIAVRKDLQYPPFRDMLHIMVSSPSTMRGHAMAHKIVTDLSSRFVGTSEDIVIFGPYEEAIYKLHDHYRLSIMIRGKDLFPIRDYIYHSWIFTVEGVSMTVDPI